jgi:hypothetical protein
MTVRQHVPDEVDREILAVVENVRQADHDRERALERRNLAFALANERGKTSGDIARLTGVPPGAAIHAIRTGHRLIRRRRSSMKAAA